ncbi:Tarsl2 protein [Capsaspora owczarzaki ATCC 30864]|uniref:threonine--tRNA ligase n=1 Tax=Capsaspora owczarzaki (strain ATCC 30864) TaxID=595528 RepID=A0A0D2UP46_CAPO3|nr:Tarsl2 protein [Capsaspora owczarzaki ATCC 30864]
MLVSTGGVVAPWLARAMATHAFRDARLALFKRHYEASDGATPTTTSAGIDSRSSSETAMAADARRGALKACFKPARADAAPVTVDLASDSKASVIQLAKAALGSTLELVTCTVNGKPWDLTRPLALFINEHAQDAPSSTLEVELLSFDSNAAKHVAWHSAAHVLGAAMEEVYGDDVVLCDGPAISEGGFFYEGMLANGRGSISTTDLAPLVAKATAFISAKHPYQRVSVSVADALAMFPENPFKQHFIRKAAAAAAPSSPLISIYRCGDFVDLCRGPHIINTGVVGAITFHAVSAAEWASPLASAPAALPSPIPLQRVYGISFPKAAMLKEWVTAREEAKLRDHRLIGAAQQLFMFHPYSPGSAFMLPHGMKIISRLQEYIRLAYIHYGYQEVSTPIVYSKELWETSGHLQHYAQDMFAVTGGLTPAAPAAGAAAGAAGHSHHHADSDASSDATQALKPMNCPGHCLIFQRKHYSYRELPIRLADFSPLHRNEAKGALSGLTRVRRFHQDDAHIFCTPEQIQAEILNVLGFVREVYGRLGFSEFTLKLSTRPESFVGSIEQWDYAESCLKDALQQTCGSNWTLNPGDGAFYGPKIDITIRDAIGRQHQTATVQLDFQLPQRFGLRYFDANQQAHTPVMIHRAVLGSLERMFAILIENTAGRWPLWLSPRQVAVCSVDPSVNEYAAEVCKQLEKVSLRLPGSVFEVKNNVTTDSSAATPNGSSSAFALQVEADLSDNRLSKKIRDAQVSQFNYIVVTGAREAADRTLNVRDRTGAQLGTMSFDKFVQLLHDQMA